MNNKITIIILLVLVALAGGFYFYNKKVEQKRPIACNMEAKLCPDGSTVGRTGPNCEFALCPTTEIKEEATTKTGTISGTITTSPTCPVERIPPEPGCAPRPYATSIEIKQIGKTFILKTIKSDDLGKFNTELPLGSYELKPAGGSVFPSCGSTTVQVESGQNSVVDISCDTGIR